MTVRSVRIFKSVLAAALATAVLSLLFTLKAQLGLIPRFELIRWLTDIGHSGFGTPDGARAVGWTAHAAIGTLLWGGIFGMFYERCPGTSDLEKGLAIGIAAWLAMMVVLMPFTCGGPFGINIGLGATLMPLIFCLVYGAVLGLAYAALQLESPLKIQSRRPSI